MVVVATHAQTPAQTSPPPTTGAALVAGRVIDARSQSPIAFATVQIQPSGAQTLTDGDGRFVFSDLPAVQISLMASKPGWIAGGAGRRLPIGAVTFRMLADGERRNDLTIALTRYAAISGHVFDESGEPIVNVDVRAFQHTWVAGHRRDVFVQRVHTDDRGEYPLLESHPRRYVIVVPTTVTTQPAGFTDATRFQQSFLQTMAAIGSAPTFLDTATMPAGSRSVIGSPFDLPLPPTDGSAWQTYPTTFAPSARSLTSAAVIRAVSGEDRAATDITMRLVATYQVSGTVQGPDGPAVLHAVHLLPAESADAPLVDAATAITDATGGFTFFGVPAGQYVARVVRLPTLTGPGERYAIGGGTDAIKNIMHVTGGPSSAPAPLPTEPLLSVDQAVTVGDRAITGIELTLRPGARIKGRVEFDGTAPRPTAAQLRAAFIQVERADGSQNSFLTPGGQFLSESEFATESLWPGRYMIHVNATVAGWTFAGATANGQDISDTPFDLESDLSDVVITFTDHPVTVKGIVTGDDPKDAPYAVIIFPSDSKAWVDFGRGSRRVHMAWTDARGSFTLAAPPPGEYLSHRSPG